MVAKTPPKQKKMVVPLNPVLVRETLKKVEMCMGRLQELQYTVRGGKKVISGVSLSPRSTKAYLRTSLRCKQESLRIKNGGAKKSPVGKISPVGKFPANTVGGEWQRMSLPAMLLGETVGEILQASKFAREIVEAVAENGKTTTLDDPKTPLTQQRNQRSKLEDTELRARRKREKQDKHQSNRTETHSPSLRRAQSRINFKVSPPSKRDVDKENARYLANRVSPRNRPWSKKTVLFPNPLFLSSDNSQQPKFCRTKSPVITRNRQTPHKFLIKSPVSASKFQVKIKSPPVVVSRSPSRLASLGKQSPTRPVSQSPLRLLSLSKPVPKRPVSQSPLRLLSLSKQTPKRFVSRSPPRLVNLSKQSPKRSVASKLRRSFSPSMAASKLRQSFSPSRFAARLVSPLKSRKTAQKIDENISISGLKQRPGPSNIQMRI